MVNDVVPADEVLERAFDRARSVALNSPSSVRLSKLWAPESVQLSERDAMARGVEWMASLCDYQDFDEGPRASSERREPRRVGRSR